MEKDSSELRRAALGCFGCNIANAGTKMPSFVVLRQCTEWLGSLGSMVKIGKDESYGKSEDQRRFTQTVTLKWNRLI